MKHCLGGDGGMSPEGISKCLAALGDALTDDCKAFQAVTAACHDELMVAGGICTAEQTDGEGMSCLMRHTPLDNLGGGCRDVVLGVLRVEFDLLLGGLIPGVHRLQ